MIQSAPAAPAAAVALFGEQLARADQYAALLASTGVEHGLIGPREVPKLWDRHLMNCALVAGLCEPEASVIDVGSGAGLPGLVLAIARPDLTITLVEPMLRRTRWLETAISELGLTNVTVRRARAEALWGEVQADHVTARAVARLDELARWCLPLVRPRGSLLAMKGSSAADEVAEASGVLPTAGAASWEVVTVGEGLVQEPTQVVIVRVDERGGRVPPKPPSGRPRKVKKAGPRARPSGRP